MLVCGLRPLPVSTASGGSFTARFVYSPRSDYVVRLAATAQSLHMACAAAAVHADVLSPFLHFNGELSLIHI